MGRQAKGTFFNYFLCTKRTLAFGRGGGDEGGICIDDGWVDYILSWVASRKRMKAC